MQQARALAGADLRHQGGGGLVHLDHVVAIDLGRRECPC